ncbi:MAG: hypothetical protein ACHQDY_03100 [Solirubrobacterales bacterium]
MGGLGAGGAHQLAGLLIGGLHAVDRGAVGFGDALARALLGMPAQLLSGAFRGGEDVLHAA